MKHKKGVKMAEERHKSETALERILIGREGNGFFLFLNFFFRQAFFPLIHKIDLDQSLSDFSFRKLLHLLVGMCFLFAESRAQRMSSEIPRESSSFFFAGNRFGRRFRCGQI